MQVLKIRDARAPLSIMVAAVGAALLLLGPLAGEAHALQCGQSLVVVGDSMAQVLERCGEPTTAHVRTETTVVWIEYPRPGFAGRAHESTVLIETWTYDFGPGRFIERLVFRDGVLVRMGPVRGSGRLR